MLTRRKPVSFIATSMPEVTIPFYRDILGLTLKETSPYALVFQDGAHVLRVQIVPDLLPASHTVYGWQVSDISDEAKALAKSGISMLQFDHLEQDTQRIWTTPDGNKIAWFKDPSGNILSLTEYV